MDSKIHLWDSNIRLWISFNEFIELLKEVSKKIDNKLLNISCASIRYDIVEINNIICGSHLREPIKTIIAFIECTGGESYKNDIGEDIAIFQFNMLQATRSDMTRFSQDEIYALQEALFIFNANKKTIKILKPIYADLKEIKIIEGKIQHYFLNLFKDIFKPKS